MFCTIPTGQRTLDDVVEVYSPAEAARHVAGGFTIDASRTGVLASVSGHAILGRTDGAMVHWLNDVMPLQPSDTECAVLMRIDTTQWGGRCHRLPVVEARWRFEEGVTVLRLCADHADRLIRNDRCVQVRPLELAGRRYYTADVEDG